MEIYKFRCRNCGSAKCEKISDSTFKCLYCGTTEDVILEPKTAKTDEKNENFSQNHDKNADFHEINQKNNIEKNEEKSAKKDSTAFQKSLILFIVTVCFGMFGVHKLVQGKVFMGIVYLFTFGLFFIGYAVDCLVNFCNMLSEVFKLLGDKNEE